MKKVKALLTVMVELEVPEHFSEDDIATTFDELDYTFLDSTGDCTVIDAEIRDMSAIASVP